MDYFDDEPTLGGGYERAFEARIDDPDGIPRRIVVRVRGRFERISVSLEEVHKNQPGVLMRYDDAHGRFHRHRPGWPQPLGEIAEYLDDVPKNRHTSHAIDAIRNEARYTAWEAEVFGREGGEPR